MMSDICASSGKTRSGLLCCQRCVLDPEKRGTFADVAEALQCYIQTAVDYHSVLFYFCIPSAYACSSEVTVTSTGPPSFVSHRGFLIHPPVLALFGFFSFFSLPPPGGLDRLRAFSLPSLACVGGEVGFHVLLIEPN